ncbi:uncharacterized protein L3040_008624 [Drepanopeziza brunnea f. sp. 'multigermtubi']|uniref:uncharacterized protein n=1 Tax=Drepanopeziza brunnea f. sp. 'multigermtubi' TaxID=698441 RepID=UPI00239623B3|nr:hypothetical protein L3040_008624 [Drepanopeziza brunnea f. sp. 'multigermtubi']
MLFKAESVQVDWFQPCRVCGYVLHGMDGWIGFETRMGLILRSGPGECCVAGGRCYFRDSVPSRWRFNPYGQDS